MTKRDNKARACAPNFASGRVKVPWSRARVWWLAGAGCAYPASSLSLPLPRKVLYLPLPSSHPKVNSMCKYSKRLLKVLSPQVFVVLRNLWQRESEESWYPWVNAQRMWFASRVRLMGVSSDSAISLLLFAIKVDTDRSDKRLQHCDPPKQLQLPVLMWASEYERSQSSPISTPYLALLRHLGCNSLFYINS